ncbi:MAG: hypothetical protein V3R37_04745 [Rhodospirillales bacterium]
MVNVKINQTLTALALGLAISLTSAFSATANDDVYADSYFDADNGFVAQTGTPIEQAAVPVHIQEAMEIH